MSDPLNGFPANQGFEAVFQAGVGIEQVGGVAAAEGLYDEHALLRIRVDPCNRLRTDWQTPVPESAYILCQQALC